MQFRCSQCHHAFEAPDDPAACPNCRAEAGIEAVHGVPVPMRLFGLLLGAVILVSAGGGVLSRLAG